MKTTLINLSLALILSTSGFLLGKTMQTTDHIDTEKEIIANNPYTNTKLVDGELMPVIYLPELTIEAEAPKVEYIHAEIVNGEVLPIVNLPELTIKA